MDGLDVELVVDELDDEHHDPARARAVVHGGVLARGTELVAVGARGLEAVVPVGEHDRSAARRARVMAAIAVGIVDGAELVDDTVDIDTAGERGLRLDLFGEPGCEAEAPDRIDVGTRRAQEGETVGFRLGRGALVRQHAGVAGLG